MNKTEMGSSSTTGLTNSGSDSVLINNRKLKRKQSNRESAKRSRMRKQKHLDDLTAQVTHLREENGRIVAGISVTTQHYVTVEAENSILRAQLLELNQRLDSLNEIVCFVESAGVFDCGGGGGGGGGGVYDGVMNPYNMASACTTADVFNCC